MHIRVVLKIESGKVYAPTPRIHSISQENSPGECVPQSDNMYPSLIDLEV